MYRPNIAYWERNPTVVLNANLSAIAKELDRNANMIQSLSNTKLSVSAVANVTATTGTSSTIKNDSVVIGASVTDALNKLNNDIKVQQVSSVFNRTGNITAQFDDYNSDLIRNLSAFAGITVTQALNAANTLIQGLESSKVNRVGDTMTGTLLMSNASVVVHNDDGVDNGLSIRGTWGSNVHDLELIPDITHPRRWYFQSDSTSEIQLYLQNTSTGGARFITDHLQSDDLFVSSDATIVGTTYGADAEFDGDVTIGGTTYGADAEFDGDVKIINAEGEAKGFNVRGVWSGNSYYLRMVPDTSTARRWLIQAGSSGEIQLELRNSATGEARFITDQITAGGVYSTGNITADATIYAATIDAGNFFGQTYVGDSSSALFGHTNYKDSSTQFQFAAGATGAVYIAGRDANDTHIRSYGGEIYLRAIQSESVTGNYCEIKGDYSGSTYQWTFSGTVGMGSTLTVDGTSNLSGGLYLRNDSLEQCGWFGYNSSYSNPFVAFYSGTTRFGYIQSYSLADLAGATLPFRIGSDSGHDMLLDPAGGKVFVDGTITVDSDSLYQLDLKSDAGDRTCGIKFNRGDIYTNFGIYNSGGNLYVSKGTGTPDTIKLTIADAVTRSYNPLTVTEGMVVGSHAVTPVDGRIYIGHASDAQVRFFNIANSSDYFLYKYNITGQYLEWIPNGSTAVASLSKSGNFILAGDITAVNATLTGDVSIGTTSTDALTVYATTTFQNNVDVNGSFLYANTINCTSLASIASVSASAWTKAAGVTTAPAVYRYGDNTIRFEGDFVTSSSKAAGTLMASISGNPLSLIANRVHYFTGYIGTNFASFYITYTSASTTTYIYTVTGVAASTTHLTGQMLDV